MTDTPPTSAELGATDALARALLAAGIRSEPNHPTTLDAAYALDIALAALGYEVRPICTTCTALHSVRSASGMPIHQAAEAHRACLDCGADVDHRLDREWHRLGNADHAWRPIEQAAEAADREVAEADGSLSTSAAADLDTLQTGPYSVDEQFRKAHPADPPCDCGVPWLHPSAAADPLDVEALMFWFRWALDALGPEPPGAGRLYASQYGEAEAAYAAAKEPRRYPESGEER